MSAEEPHLTGDTDRIEFDAGTIAFPNEAQLARQLRHAIEKDEMTITDFDEWLTKPWTAYNFLQGRVAGHGAADRALAKDAASIDPVKIDPADEAAFHASNPALKHLTDWHNAKDKRDWEKVHPVEAKEVRDAITALHARLTPYLRVYENTSKRIGLEKDLNIVESGLRRTKEFLWDNAAEHPELSVALAVMGFLTLSRLKGTNLMKYLIYGGGLAVGGAFLRREFGVQPTEALAEVMERLGQKGFADKLRDVRDTMKRVAFDEKTAGSLPEYYYKKLSDEAIVSKDHMVNMNRFPEQTAFHFLLQQNPKKFVEWYDAAYRWKLAAPGKTPPAEVARLAHQMTRGSNVQESVKNMSSKEKTLALMNVAESVFAYLAHQNPEIAAIAGKPGATSAQRGIGVLEKKYIDGSFFDYVWNLYFQKHKDVLKDPSIPDAKKEQLKRVTEDMKKDLDRVALNIRLHGSDVIDFRDVLMGETDKDDKIPAFDGLGFSDAEIKSAVDAVIAKAIELKDDAMKKGTDIYNEYLDPFVVSPLKDKAKEVYEYIFVEDLGGGINRFQKAIQDAKNAGSATVTVVLNSRLAEALKQAGLSAGQIVGDKWELALAKAEEIAKEMEEARKMREVLQTIQVKYGLGAFRGGATEGLLVTLDTAAYPVMQNYRWTIKVRMIPEIDSSIPATRRTSPQPESFEGVANRGRPLSAAAYSDYPLYGLSTPPALQATDPATGRVTPSTGYRWRRRAEVSFEAATPVGHPVSTSVSITKPFYLP